MKNLTILRGHGKGGVPEPFQSIVLSRGELWTIVGNTGSGKSRLIKDIEQLCDQVYSIEDCRLIPITEEIASRYREME